MKKKVLIYWIYHYAVGHFVELMEIIANCKSANPGIEIHALVDERMPIELGKYFFMLERILPVNTQELIQRKNKHELISSIDNNYDYIIYPQQFSYHNYLPQNLIQAFHLIKSNVKAIEWSGYNNDENCPIKTNEYSPFRLVLPPNSNQKVLNTANRPIFSIILKGASRESIWPTIKTWFTLLTYIKDQFPESAFLITGITDVFGSNKDKAKKNVAKLKSQLSKIDDVLFFFDIGIEQQLQIIEQSDILISPHTGFAFLAPTVGTPWIALSGGRWDEYQIARMPFYSILPKCERFPCYNEMKNSCKLRIKTRQPIKCMSNNLLKTKTELISAIKFLLNPTVTFDQSFSLYKKLALEKGVNINKLWRINKYEKYTSKH